MLQFIETNIPLAHSEGARQVVCHWSREMNGLIVIGSRQYKHFSQDAFPLGTGVQSILDHSTKGAIMRPGGEDHIVMGNSQHELVEEIRGHLPHLTVVGKPARLESILHLTERIAARKVQSMENR